jgi:hypothetical protein
MCKELPVILVNKVVDPKRIIGKKWRAKEEERHKGSLTQKSILRPIGLFYGHLVFLCTVFAYCVTKNLATLTSAKTPMEKNARKPMKK